MLKDRDNKAEFDFTTTSAGSSDNPDSSNSEGVKIKVDKQEMLNVVVKSAMGGVASAWAVKSALGDE